MSYFNKSDFINLKYLIVSTGLVNNRDIMDVKDEKDLFQRLQSLLTGMPGVDDPANIIEELFNESFYHLKHYSYLHKNGICPMSYDGNEWGINFTDESILLIRLYQNLSKNDFFYVLRNFMGVQEEKYLNFEMDFNELNANEYLPKVYNWLQQQRNPFIEKVQLLMKDRLGDIVTQQESMSTNQSSDGFQGVCLIINNEKFKSVRYRERRGTIEDENNIVYTFSKLNYDVLVYRDVKMENINKALNHAKSRVKMEHRMFITFVLSHGEIGKFVTSDDKEIEFEKLWGQFSGSQFQALIGKPKLFFFVCCQGSNLNKAVYSDKKTNDFSTIEFDAITSPGGHPDTADFFFGYATYKTFQSFRSTLNGTFYVKNLCETINRDPKKSISDIHIEVQRRVAESKISDTNSFQMSYHENMLREHCYFDISN